MKDGSKACLFCGSRFTFDAYELVDSMPADEPCLGCVRLFAILAESGRQKAAKGPALEHVDVMDLSPAAIETRLRAGRAQTPVRDFARAAAGDTDHE